MFEIPFAKGGILHEDIPGQNRHRYYCQQKCAAQVGHQNIPLLFPAIVEKKVALNNFYLPVPHFTINLSADLIIAPMEQAKQFLYSAIELELR